MSLFGPWYTNMNQYNQDNGIDEAALEAARQQQMTQQQAASHQQTQQTMDPRTAGTAAYQPMQDSGAGGGNAGASARPAQTQVTNRPTTTVAAPGSSRARTAPPSQTAASAANTDVTFDPANPLRAVTNILAQMGIRTGTGNPLARSMLQMAPGLASSFLVNGATNGGSMGAPGASIADQFRDYLQMSMQSDPRQQLRQASLLMGGIGQRRDQYNQGILNNPNGQINPFMEQLNELMDSNPNALPGMVSSLRTPMLGSYGRAYGDALQGMYDTSYGMFPDSMDQGSDIFNYLTRVGSRGLF